MHKCIYRYVTYNAYKKTVRKLADLIKMWKLNGAD